MVRHCSLRRRNNSDKSFVDLEKRAGNYTNICRNSYTIIGKESKKTYEYGNISSEKCIGNWWEYTGFEKYRLLRLIASVTC